MTEPDWENLHPDDWPHTPPLDVFLRLGEKDRNLWWRLSCGHHLNLFDEVIEALRGAA